MDGELSIVIPTHERPGFLVRALAHYGTAPFACIVVDSSAEPLPAPLRTGKRLDYRHVPGAGFATKLRACLESVSTPYVVLGADDDLLRPAALARCVAFLQDRPDHATAHGQFLFFVRSRARAWGIRAYWPRRDWQVDQDDPVSRQLRLMGSYMHQAYSVHRTEILREAFRRLDGAVTNSELIEFVIGLTATARGKHATLPVFYEARQDLPDSWSRGLGTAYPNLRQLHERNADPEEYGRFLALWEDLLIDAAGIDRAAARAAAIRGVEAYLAHEEEARDAMAESGVFHRDLTLAVRQPAAWPSRWGEALEDIVAMGRLIMAYDCGIDRGILDEPDEIGPGGSLFIYGAGTAGLLLLEMLERAGIGPVAGFVDTHRTGTVGGLPCLALPDYLARRTPDDRVIVASHAHPVIRRALAQAGVDGVLNAHYRIFLDRPQAP